MRKSLRPTNKEMLELRLYYEKIITEKFSRAAAKLGARLIFEKPTKYYAIHPGVPIVLVCRLELVLATITTIDKELRIKLCRAAEKAFSNIDKLPVMERPSL